MSALLATLFVLSGAAALLYQVAWQRVLFAIYGVNIESVAIIVTAFMVGLGVGAALGGVLSRRWPRARLAWFVIVEAALGAFGLASLPLFHVVGEATLHWSLPAVAAVTFVLVVLPTTLMGATLPLVVAHAISKNRNVGASLGLYYAVNTAGSAIASILAATVLLATLGLGHTVFVAAALNLVASACVAALAIVERRQQGRA